MLENEQHEHPLAATSKELLNEHTNTLSQWPNPNIVDIDSWQWPTALPSTPL